MPKRKHVNKVRMAPRTDANQGVREHTERVRKQNEYIARKIEEYRQKQEELRKMMEEQQQESTAGQNIDGLAGDRDVANE